MAQIPPLKVNITADPSLSPHFQLTLDQLYYRLTHLYQANDHLDAKLLGLLQAAALILTLTGVLKFPALIYRPDPLPVIALAAGFLIFAAMLLLTLRAWSPADIHLPGPNDWDTVYDDYITVNIDRTINQLVQDGLNAQHRLLALNARKAARLKWAVALFAAQITGLLALALL